MSDTESLNVLFACSRNQWRSPTAERIWRRTPGVNVRSAGTSSKARRTLGLADLRWADLIVVMESKHAERIRANFPDVVRFKKMHVLDIPDEYGYMDEELIEILREKTEPLILGEPE